MNNINPILENHLTSIRVRGAMNHLAAKGYSQESIAKFVDGHIKRTSRLKQSVLSPSKKK